MIENIVNSVNDFLWTYILVVMLVGLGIYFTVKMKFMQIFLLKEIFRSVFEKAPKTKSSSNEISSMQAFFIGAATRIGTGNMAGVAIAITIGGPGAIFWMWFAAVLGGASAFVESTLAQIYKVKTDEGFKGGPGYYIQKQLGLKWPSMIFAIAIILSFGLIFNAVQTNTITSAFNYSFGISPILMGVFVTILTALIIFGGVKRIANFTQIIVPIMSVFYIILALYIIITNISDVPVAFLSIIKSAFGLEQISGGGIGVAIMNGVKRGLFSNEAGMGSAPNAAATANVSHPVKQGFVQLLGVFFDTLIVCSCTAFIIMLSKVETAGDLSGIEITQAAMTQHFGSWASIFLAFAIFTFAFSSIVGGYYYGEANLGFIHNSPIVLLIYRVTVLIMIMFGAVANLQIVWTLADLSMAIMAVINLVAIAILGKFSFAALDDYISQRKFGINPIFYASNISGLKGVECWDSDKL
ncbi:alanine/glycine:cation symporter family protein [Lysinibacillus pakistanensis]|uniref:Amino acid carrier protein n=1 Tax=Lysinibacillus pakistanensis TaxID=759811 RepID=A0ABX6DCC3_9BACI|nr:amino acid carrier protein [Lysinibacillus pakistanensis]